MRQANGSPLPDGVKFLIWPRYVLSVDGVEVRLSRYRAEIILFLMSKPGAGCPRTPVDLCTTARISAISAWQARSAPGSAR